MAGSDCFRRTRDLDGRPRMPSRGELIHVAIVYASRQQHRRLPQRRALRAAVYAVGRGQRPCGPIRPARAGVLLGLRHTGAGNGFFAGEIAEARLYDKALTAAEVAASFYAAGRREVALEQVLKALTSEQQQQRDRLAHRTAEPARANHFGAIASPPSGLRGEPAAADADVRPDARRRGEAGRTG